MHKTFYPKDDIDRQYVLFTKTSRPSLAFFFCKYELIHQLWMEHWQVQRVEPEQSQNGCTLSVLNVCLKCIVRNALLISCDKTFFTRTFSCNQYPVTVALLQLQHVLRKGVRRLGSIENWLDVAIEELDEYTKSKEKLIAAAAATAVRSNNNNIKSNSKTTKSSKQKWKRKQLYGYFKQQTKKIAHNMTMAKEGKS